jgi:hypothetical protein
MATVRSTSMEDTEPSNPYNQGLCTHQSVTSKIDDALACPVGPWIFQRSCRGEEDWLDSTWQG